MYLYFIYKCWQVDNDFNKIIYIYKTPGKMWIINKNITVFIPHNEFEMIICYIAVIISLTSICLSDTGQLFPPSQRYILDCIIQWNICMNAFRQASIFIQISVWQFSLYLPYQIKVETLPGCFDWVVPVTVPRDSRGELIAVVCKAGNLTSVQCC